MGGGGVREAAADLSRPRRALSAIAPTVHAEGRLRIVEQFGIVYLLLNVARDQQLVEKHGKAAGIDIKVDHVKLSGGSAVNDALLSGSIDIAGAGVGPLLTVRGVASLGNFPYYLVSNNPPVKTIGNRERIPQPGRNAIGQGRTGVALQPSQGGVQA